MNIQTRKVTQQGSSAALPLTPLINDNDSKNDYMLQHAQDLREQTQRLESSVFLDLVKSNENTTATMTNLTLVGITPIEDF
jgi:hypothetical protein